jgi:hypothetical protein
VESSDFDFEFGVNIHETGLRLGRNTEPPIVGGSKNASFCPFSNYLYSASYNGGARVIFEA